MNIKQKVIREASKRLLLTDLTCWNVVEEILKDLYKKAHEDGVAYYRDKYVYKESRQKPIYQYDLKGILIDKFDSIKDASYLLNIPESSIVMNLKNKTRRCHVFVFKYVNNEKSKRREVKNRFVKTNR